MKTSQGEHSGRWYIIMGWLARLFINSSLLTFSLFCLLPFLVIIAASFSTEESLSRYGYSIWPRQFSLQAYQLVFVSAGKILRAYGISALVTAVGSSLSMVTMALMAYAISRRQFQLRQGVAFYIFFTMLFSGGLVPSYILITQYLRLKDTLWALILPGLVNGWWVLVLRAFFQDLPEELLDAARIDGAGEWRIFFQIAVPLSTPGLATIALFTMLSYWNDFFSALLYISNETLYPIQYLLWLVLQTAEMLQQTAQEIVIRVVVPVLPLRMAMAVLTILPIAFGYLLVQKYLVSGIRLGSLKG